MERRILKASSGMMLTDGKIYGTTIYLGESVDESTFYEIPESEIPNLEETEAEVEDYVNALSRLGVDINDKK